MDKREHVRHRLGLALAVSWQDDRGIEQHLRTTTCDVSAGGVRVQAPAAPVAGTRVRFALTLPATMAGLPDLEIRAQGAVVRVERVAGDGVSAFAIRNDAFTIHTAGSVLADGGSYEPSQH